MEAVIKHAKIRTVVTQSDGSYRVQTDSYNENLSSIKQEIQQRIITTPETWLADFIKCLEPFKNGDTRELTIQLTNEHERMMIVKTWTVSKEIFGRR